MICPHCHAEYVDGITYCPDCQVDLVYPTSGFQHNKRNPAENVNSDQWIMIYRPVHAQELALIKMILDREEIPYYIGNENTRRSALFSPVNMGFELWVPESLMEKVAEILRDELDIK